MTCNAEERGMGVAAAKFILSLALLLAIASYLVRCSQTTRVTCTSSPASVCTACSKHL